MTTSTLRLLVAFAVLTADPTAARGDARADAADHVARATEAHKRGDFANARAELEAAYALDPQPDLLYALGQVHAKLGDCAAAEASFRRFAATQSDPQVARVVEQAIASCQPAAPVVEPAGDPAEPPAPAALPSQPSQPAPPPPALVASATARSPWYRDRLGDALVAGGVAAIAVSVIAYLGARADLDEAEDRVATPELSRYDDLLASARAKRTFAVVLAVAGGVAVMSGGLRFALRDGREPRLSATPVHGGAILSFGGHL